MKTGFTSLAILAALSLAHTAAAQTVDDRPSGGQDVIIQNTPFASAGGTVRLVAPRPVAPQEDPLNAFSEAQTVDGMIVSLTIDGDTAVLEDAVAARVPRTAANRDGKGLDDSDVVIVTAFAGGREVARAVVPDLVRNTQEGEGLVLMTRRQLSLALAADRPIDRIQVEAPATNARASFNTSASYDWICEADPRNKWCAGRDNQ